MIESAEPVGAADHEQHARVQPVAHDFRKGFADPVNAWHIRYILERHEEQNLGGARPLSLLLRERALGYGERGQKHRNEDKNCRFPQGKKIIGLLLRRCVDRWGGVMFCESSHVPWRAEEGLL